MKLETWGAAEAEKILRERLTEAMDYRSQFEEQWRTNEKSLFKKTKAGASVAINSKIDEEFAEEEYNDKGLVQVNYIMRDVRLIHSQMSSNPPIVMPRPASPDMADRRAADAANKLVHHAIRQHSMPEVFDRGNLNILSYGLGWLKGYWDPDAGDILDFDEATGELTMEGSYVIKVPSVWKVFADPNATCAEDIVWIFEEFSLTMEVAKATFPGKEELLKKLLRDQGEADDGTSGTAITSKRPKAVTVYQYWEKGTPYNGMIGRFCWCTKDGKLLSPIKKNPHSFSKTTKDGRRLPAVARLPYHLSTDIDIPDSFMGESVVSYSSELQRVMQQIDNVTLDCLKAHGVARMSLPEGCDIKDDSITNCTYDIIKYTGNRPPSFMEAMPMTPEMGNFRNKMSAEIQMQDGINESVLGQQSREQSAVLMQYATQQSNMTRKRLFNKYVKQVEMVYRDYLDIVREKWDTPRTIKVIGKEKAFEVADIKGADIAGGYDIVMEYGSNLSLDPVMRREELMQMAPFLKEAGISMRTILSMMRLNDVERGYDMADLGATRQMEYFETMVALKQYIAPRELEGHKEYLEFAYQYVNTAEYKHLDEQSKSFIDQHIKAREDLGVKTPEAGPEVPGAPEAPVEEAPPPNLAALLGG